MSAHTHKIFINKQIYFIIMERTKHFISFTKGEWSHIGGNPKDVAFELVALCIYTKTRIIIYQDYDRSKYIMVDVNPLDESNKEFMLKEKSCRVMVTSIEGGSEGEFYSRYNSYDAAIDWLAYYIEHGNYIECYNESY